MSSPLPPVAIKISAQNEALKELEKARAEIVRLTETARRNLGQNFPQATQASTRGVQAIRSGMQALAFEATGIQGPIGRVSTGLLTFAAGSTLVLGVTAGIAAIATAYKLSAAAANEFTDANEKALATQRELLLQAHPELGARLTARDAVADAQAKLEAARAALEQAQHPPGVIVGPGGAAMPGRVDEAKVAEINTLIQTLSKNLQLAQENAARVTKGMVDDQAKSAQRIADQAIAEAQRMAHEWVAAWRRELEMLPTLGGGLGPGLTAPERLQRIPTTISLAPLPTVGTSLNKLPSAEDLKFNLTSSTGEIRELSTVLRASAEAARQAAQAHEQLAISIIGGVSAMVASLIGGGGAGGFLSGLGGLVSLANPIAGAVVSGLGAVVGSAEGPGRVVIDGYTQRALDQQRKQEESKRNVIVLQVVDAKGNVRDQIYDVTRYQNRGGTAGGIQARSDGGAVTTRTG